MQQWFTIAFAVQGWSKPHVLGSMVAITKHIQNVSTLALTRHSYNAAYCFVQIIHYHERRKSKLGLVWLEF